MLKYLYVRLRTACSVSCNGLKGHVLGHVPLLNGLRSQVFGLQGQSSATHAVTADHTARLCCDRASTIQCLLRTASPQQSMQTHLLHQLGYVLEEGHQQ
jgi:hypothetical protein